MPITSEFRDDSRFIFLKKVFMASYFVLIFYWYYFAYISNLFTSDVVIQILQFKLVYGLSKLSSIMILLSLFISFLISFDLFDSSKDIKNFSGKIFLISLTQLFLILCFLSKDLLSFYIFFEASIVPVFFIIYLYGGEERNYASTKFFIYTIFASMFILFVIAYLYLLTGSVVPSDIINSPLFVNLNEKTKIILAILFMIGFCVKIPTFPFHTWLPSAHVQAPTSGSMLLAGVLIKLGGYGIIAFAIPIFYDQLFDVKDIFIIIAMISMIYSSVVAFGQTDIKKIIAYSSIAHMSYVLCGIFSFTKDGTNGAIFQMISHGIVSASLFYCIGILYNKTHKRDIVDYGWVYNLMPTFSKFLILITMASIGLPGTIGFVGEFINLYSLVNVSFAYCFIMCLGSLFGAIYMLYFLREILYNFKTESPISREEAKMSLTQVVYLFLVSLVIIILGIYPSFIFSII